MKNIRYNLICETEDGMKDVVYSQVVYESYLPPKNAPINVVVGCVWNSDGVRKSKYVNIDDINLSFISDDDKVILKNDIECIERDEESRLLKLIPAWSLSLHGELENIDEQMNYTVEKLYNGNFLSGY